MNKEDLKLKIDKIIEGIAKETCVYIQYYGEDNNEFTYEIAIGRSSITFNYKTGEFVVYMCHSNYTEMYKPYKTKNTREFKNNAYSLICRAIKEHKYDNRLFLEDIARKIEKHTGMSWEYIGEDNDSLTIDFGYNISYMKNLGGKGLQFTLDVGNGKDIINIVENNEKQFINKVVQAFNTASRNKLDITNKKNKITPNKEIISKASELIKNKKSGTIRLYEDNCWWADLEYLENGNCRFWVGFEDKRTGKSGGSIFTIYDLINKRYGCEFKVKEAVKNKILSVYRNLVSIGLQ